MTQRAFFFTAALLVIVSISSNVGANPGITIQEISESAIDKLIHDRNNRVVLAFMAAWCGPCIDELPVLNKLYRKYKTQGLKLIGISIDLQGPQAMQPVIDKLKIAFPVYWYGESAVQKFSLFAIPMIFWVKNGQIVEKLPGRRSREALDKKIRKFLAE
ncbi:MAG: TlpA disulfide reductase family protein [Deltaproteobacteria bacterium]